MSPLLVDTFLKGDWLTDKKASEGHFATGARCLPTLLRAVQLPRSRENQKALEVIRQILQPNLRGGPTLLDRFAAKLSYN